MIREKPFSKEEVSSGEGVQLYQINAMEFFRWSVGVNRDNVLDIPDNYKSVMSWITNPNVMMYCDPSYIDTELEKRMLEGIEWEKEENLSEAIERERVSKLSKAIAELKKRINKKGRQNKSVKELEEKITKLENKLENKGRDDYANLGKIYSMSFDYKDQENFLRCIQNADCKVMVSNYD